MAGRRQHYLPRLLQRGFLHDHADGKERTWLHRRGRTPRLVGIKDVGISEYFYSRASSDGERTLDDLITEMEGNLGTIIDEYRASEGNAQVDPMVAAHTLIHLVTRTAHIREVISAGIKRLLEQTETLFTDPVWFGAALGLNAIELSPIAMEENRKTAIKLEAIGMPSAFSERLMSFLVREKGPRLLEQAVGPLRLAFSRL